MLTFFAVQATIFVLTTWLALGLSTAVWSTSYLLTLPMLLVNFAAFYGFSALLAVTTRSTVACVFGSIVFWLLCLLMNVGRHALVAYDLGEFSAVSRILAETAYWMLPKPVDMAAVLHDTLRTEPLAARVEDFGIVQAKGAFHPALSVGTALLFSMLMLAMSAYEVETLEY